MRGAQSLRADVHASSSKHGARAPHAVPEWGLYLASGP